MASFLSLPPELRDMIYDLVFTTSSPPQKSITLLNRVPGSLSLRLTNSFIAHESDRSYLKASTRYDTVRQDLISDTVTYYDRIATRVYITGIDPAQASITNHHNLALSLCHPNPRCKHACAKKGCYMCSDPKHQSCFDCGRNLAVALYCDIAAHKTEAPSLILPGSNGLLTRYGIWIEHVPRRYEATRREETTYAMWWPDQESPSGLQQKMAEVLERSPWAFEWWATAKHQQLFVDKRCEMRRNAVWTHFQNARVTKFEEQWILRLESMNSKWKMVQQLGRHFAVRGVLEWKEQYKRRAETQATKWHWPVERLIPDYDQERNTRTCRDAEWFQ
ncbi:hypothetical protein DOTSEDRAFT_29895 [Dothistroma septosporum NZE10]|uniref:Uncharacterized protein n=1 Tax=Dothistroma septosporum (strain NZE10 / CBS 128990) TaxID=675120 RepID=N1PY45_DOTSN|nr:hypothetical protein DOTSEDRAFT_29895 [Dothistroma septosporum NZE10]